MIRASSVMTPRSALVLATICGSLDLDRDDRPVVEGGAVDLRGRGGRERLRVDGREQLLGVLAQLLANDDARFIPRERCRVALELRELGDDLRGQRVATAGDHLPDLHVRRTELLQEEAEPLRTARALELVRLPEHLQGEPLAERSQRRVLECDSSAAAYTRS